jgi:hypothetical protein
MLFHKLCSEAVITTTTLIHTQMMGLKALKNVVIKLSQS